MAYGQPTYGYPQFGYQNQFGPNQFGQPMMQPQVMSPAVTQSQQQPSFQSNSQLPTLYGKVVDGIDVVKSMDIPIGMSFILPKANGETIFHKGWTNEGTTFVKEYQLVKEDEADVVSTPSIDWESKLNDIYSSIDALDKKLDKIKPPTTSVRKKKVVKEEEDEDYE